MFSFYIVDLDEGIKNANTVITEIDQNIIANDDEFSKLEKQATCVKKYLDQVACVQDIQSIDKKFSSGYLTCFSLSSTGLEYQPIQNLIPIRKF